MRYSKADRLIVIGAGITGLMTAINARLSGLDVYLLEKGKMPSGSSARIAGVLHSGARFAGWDDELAKVCFEEWKWWVSVLGKEEKKIGGYFLKTKTESDQYLESWLSSLKNIGIPFTEVENPYIGGDIKKENIDRFYFVPEIQINARKLLNKLLELAINLGVNYLPSSVIQEVERADGGYRISVRNKDTLKLEGFPVISSGIDIPEVAKIFGINVTSKVYQGSHILLNTDLTDLLEFVHKPGTYDLLIPSDLGTFITPTLVPYNGLTVSEEELAGLSQVLKNLFEIEPEVIGYMIAGRISISSPDSTLKGDYLAYTQDTILAWSNNYACGKRLAYAIADILGIKKALTAASLISD
ncbi:MAG: FAD-dependent oxidoreductase [Nitrososphaeria archaeon]|nr:FAD-dependent oxidoreductase [Conexivisphaerales archaeon]